MDTTVNEAATTPPTYRLYTEGQVVLAAFLGSVFAGCWFISRNYDQLGEPRKANRAIFWGLAITPVLVLLGFVLPKQTPSSIIILPTIFGIRGFMRQAQGTAVDAHKAAGGRIGNWWMVVGIGLLSCAGMLAIILLVALLTGALDQV